jgi:outer membrane lipoprotein-sorting protein
MKKLLLITACSILTLFTLAQNDPEAVKVLDRFSSAALSSPSVSVKFNLITVNEAENKKDTVTGSLIMSKDQYRLEMADNITWYNGSVSWNLLIKENEVTITRPGKKDDSFMSRPSSIFTLYKKGYKTKFIEENQKSGIVDLYPEDMNSELVRIRMSVGKVSSDLIGAEYKRKDGIVVYLIVKDYNLKTKPEPTDFSFNPKNYKGVEIIDMR